MTYLKQKLFQNFLKRLLALILTTALVALLLTGISSIVTNIYIANVDNRFTIYDITIIAGVNGGFIGVIISKFGAIYRKILKFINSAIIKKGVATNEQN